MANELEIWIELKPGKAVRMRMAVVEEGLPSPGESNNERQPYLGEILMAARRISQERISIDPPF
ncbi:MAG: hypothetical protein MUC40_00070 [Akkermansiaceae bacterium]|jgi:hypothetical protein|nr:hypothetical protein [Akkermansiaceae bacterium]